MKRTPTELAYVTAAVQNASPAGLVVILYDQLIKDLQGAITAIQKKDVEERVAELKHGFFVLQQLEESLNMETGGDAAKHLSRFYATIRAGMLNAHVQVSSEILQHQIQLLFEVRQAWEVADRNFARENSNTPVGNPVRNSPADNRLAVNSPVPASSAVVAHTSDEDDRVPANWNA